MAKEFRVLIIGSGIAGLLVAQGLKKNGILCTVFESEPSADHYRPREWGMSIQWGLPLLEDVLPRDLFDRVYTAANDPFFSQDPPDPGFLPTWNGATGEHIKDVPLLRMIRCSRRKLRALCAENIEVVYGKRLQDVSYNDEDNTVTAIFEDGSTETGNVLVGADGANSAVRTTIFGEEDAKPCTVPYSAVNLHVGYGDAAKALFVRSKHPIMTHAIHPDGLWLWISIQDVPDPNDPATWVFQLQTTWRKTEGEDPTSLEALKKKAETFCEPFRSANLWVPEGTTVTSNNLSYWVPVHWDNRGGRITLVGDAAHPMTFQRGQGMNHGIKDAQVLVQQLVSATADSNGVDNALQTAVDGYQTEMVERAAEEVQMGVLNTEMLHDWTRFSQSALMQKGGNPNRK
ncbi:hypothetical protein EG328_008182 [Venturia inaequalis]|uniref:FAD-binding domain-containing protein n=1 Tax=Venturia inaequalis TaxID=5025 RepID=A0A8H3UD48_VENIN|nr:hypothetical protein EG328_008182 [Venturia inaequalis]